MAEWTNTSIVDSHFSIMVVLTYCATYVSFFIRQYAVAVPSDAVQIGLIALLIIGGILFKHNDPSQPAFSWGMQLYALPVERSIIRTGNYLASNAGDLDVFAVVPTEPNALTYDVPSKLVALSGTSAFLALAGRVDSRSRGTINERLNLLDQVQHESSRETAFESLRNHGVTWLIVRVGETLAWDSARTGAVFRDGTFAIYRVKPNQY